MENNGELYKVCLTLTAAKWINCVCEEIVGETTIVFILLNVQETGFLTTISNIQPFQVSEERHIFMKSAGWRVHLVLKYTNKVKFLQVFQKLHIF